MPRIVIDNNTERIIWNFETMRRGFASYGFQLSNTNLELEVDWWSETFNQLWVSEPCWLYNSKIVYKPSINHIYFPKKLNQSWERKKPPRTWNKSFKKSKNRWKWIRIRKWDTPNSLWGWEYFSISENLENQIKRSETNM